MPWFVGKRPEAGFANVAENKSKKSTIDEFLAAAIAKKIK